MKSYAILVESEVIYSSDKPPFTDSIMKVFKLEDRPVFLRLSPPFCAKNGPVSIAEPENWGERKKLVRGADSDTKASTPVVAKVAVRTNPNSIFGNELHRRNRP